MVLSESGMSLVTKLAHVSMGAKAQQSEILFLSQEAKTNFSKIIPPMMTWTWLRRKLPLTQISESTINFPSAINYSLLVSDHSSGSRTTSRDAHNRLNILHLITFKQAIVFTDMVVKTEKSLFKVYASG